MATRRDRQAEQTRIEILDAARQLFAERGYHGTTVNSIAETAGVALQTIYDSVGSKARIVAALNDRIDDLADIPRLAAPIEASTDPVELLGIPVTITRAVIETSGDIVRTAFRGNAEPELLVLRTEGIRRHRTGMHLIAERLATLDALPANADVGAVGDAMALLCDPETWLIWIDDYGWSVDAVARWTRDALATLVLRE